MKTRSTRASRVPEIRRWAAAVIDPPRGITQDAANSCRGKPGTCWHQRCTPTAVQIRPPILSEPGGENWSFRVLGPYAPVDSHDLDRVFSGNSTRPDGPRLERLTVSSKILVLYDSRVVGIVAYENHGEDLRVHELALAPGTAYCSERIIDVALDALELACLAGGARRIVVTSRAGMCRPPLWRRGFVRIDEGCAGTWLEKTFR